MALSNPADFAKGYHAPRDAWGHPDLSGTWGTATITRLERAASEPAVLNILAAAKLVAAGALTRQESRGAHWRSDFPLTDKIGHRSFMTLADAERIAAGAPAPLRRVQS